MLEPAAPDADQGVDRGESLAASASLKKSGAHGRGGGDA